MSEYTELYGTPQAAVFNFFKQRLEEVLCRARIDSLQLCYNASVLASIAQTSVNGNTEMPLVASIHDLLQLFAAPNDFLPPDVWEQAGAQSLVFASFFQAEIAKRQQLYYWSRIGSSFYHLAARVPMKKKSDLMTEMAYNFEKWRRINACLARKLTRDSALVLRPS